MAGSHRGLANNTIIEQGGTRLHWPNRRHTPDRARDQEKIAANMIESQPQVNNGGRGYPLRVIW